MVTASFHLSSRHRVVSPACALIFRSVSRTFVAAAEEHICFGCDAGGCASTLGRRSFGVESLCSAGSPVRPRMSYKAILDARLQKPITTVLVQQWLPGAAHLLCIYHSKTVATTVQLVAFLLFLSPPPRVPRTIPHCWFSSLHRSFRRRSTMPSIPLLWTMLGLMSLISQILGQAPVQTFFPAAIPLSIRSPSMNVWFWSMNGSVPLSHAWPLAWAQLGKIRIWACKIRVDGQAYNLLGADSTNSPIYSNVTNVQITPTRSIFVMQAGPMNVTVTFLSPIEPSDWVLQSLPFSYISVEASTLDGRSHAVQVYSDINEEWLTDDLSRAVRWTQHSTGNSIYHQFQLQSPQNNVEINDQSQDGIAYYAMENRPGLTWQINLGASTRSQFEDHGALTDTFTTAFGPISPNPTVFGIAVDLGTSSTTVGPVTWTVGYVRSPSVSYADPRGTVEQLSPYFITRYGTDIGQAIDAWTVSFPEIMERAIAFDEALMETASQISPHYADLLSLATRQALGSLDITVSTDADGRPNASDVRIFMKDVGSSTATARVNPVERIYAALPALLYVNASLVGPLLAPLLDAQDSLTNIPYAAPDIGSAYPNATGASTGHPEQGIEQTGNMLILLYAHARFSGDGSLLSAHFPHRVPKYNLIKRWANYLVNQSLAPSNQINADNEGNANMTNLAIKGIIGVKAMAEISRALAQHTDAEEYDSCAAELVSSWESLAMSSDRQHLLGIYGNEGSWALMYNVYADILLGTNLINQTLLRGQTTFYESLLNSNQSLPNGIPLDSTSDITSAAWQMFTAATVQDEDVRNGLISSVWARANNNLTSGAYADRYDANSGAILEGSAGPAAGGIFSILALNLPNVTIVVNPAEVPAPGGANNGSTGTRTDGPHGDTNSAIVGDVIGGSITAAAIIALAAFLSLRKWRRSHGSMAPRDGGTTSPASHRSTLPPNVYTSQQDASHPPVPDRHRTTKVQREHAQPARLPRALSTFESPFAALNGSAAFSLNRDRAPPLPLSRAPRSLIRDTEGVVEDSSAATPLPGSVIDMHGLRTEVENLRRVVHEIQTGGLEPPPEYID
ncbi:DUF1793-domain-containing protein [Cubamyces sp. BRFM 1775]|nr:DUF1793-domain-containing protein [Cubamyces sp. BRFM 1775]